MFENSRKPILLVCLALFGLMTGQQMVNPILPPLARELGFSELALGVVWTVGAAGVVLASPFWGRRGVSWGHRPVLLISLVGALIGMLAFAIIAQLGLAGALAGPVLFTLVLLSRGLVFGLAWAATPVTAQSYVADMTSGEAERVRGMSLVGAAQGLALAVGPAVGGLLSFAGLLVPIYAAPVVLAVIAVLVWRGVPKPPAHREQRPAVKVSPFDSRLWPFLTTGFGMYLAITIVLMTVGFLVQDRLHLTAQETGQATGLITLAGAGMIVLIQAAVVPRLAWPPARLIRVGSIIMTAGMIIVAVAPNGASARRRTRRARGRHRVRHAGEHVRADAPRHPRGTGRRGRARQLQHRAHVRGRSAHGNPSQARCCRPVTLIRSQARSSATACTNSPQPRPTSSVRCC